MEISTRWTLHTVNLLGRRDIRSLHPKLTPYMRSRKPRISRNFKGWNLILYIEKWFSIFGWWVSIFNLVFGRKEEDSLNVRSHRDGRDSRRSRIAISTANRSTSRLQLSRLSWCLCSNKPCSKSEQCIAMLNGTMCLFFSPHFPRFLRNTQRIHGVLGNANHRVSWDKTSLGHWAQKTSQKNMGCLLGHPCNQRHSTWVPSRSLT